MHNIVEQQQKHTHNPGRHVLHLSKLQMYTKPAKRAHDFHFARLFSVGNAFNPNSEKAPQN